MAIEDKLNSAIEKAEANIKQFVEEKFNDLNSNMDSRFDGFLSGVVESKYTWAIVGGAGVVLFFAGYFVGRF